MVSTRSRTRTRSRSPVYGSKMKGKRVKEYPLVLRYLSLINEAMMNAPAFDHEKLRVYQASLDFVAWTTDFLSEIELKAAFKDQLDRASTSVPLNIAEGNAKWSFSDRGRFLRTAMGSALECAACLDVVVAKRVVESVRIAPGKQIHVGVVSMLSGLLQDSASRLSEEL
jgi:four helix bundle protein